MQVKATKTGRHSGVVENKSNKPKKEKFTYAEEEVEFAGTILYEVEIGDLTMQERDRLCNAAGSFLARVKKLESQSRRESKS